MSDDARAFAARMGHTLLDEPVRSWFEPPTRSGRRRERLLIAQGGQCPLCRHDLSPYVATLEHVIPRSMGGSDAAANLIVTHKACNSRRGSKLLASDLRTRRLQIVDESEP